MFSKRLAAMCVAFTVALCPISASAHENRIGNPLGVHKENLVTDFDYQDIDNRVNNLLHSIDNNTVGLYIALGVLASIGIPAYLFSNYPSLSNGQGSSYDMTKLTNPVVNQGDRISVEGSNCTIGYIDKANRKAYSAAHCFVSDKEKTQDVHNKTVYNSFGRHIGTASGTYHGSQNNDFIIIDLLNNIPAGENSFSGDAIVKIEDVKPGDTICSFSRKYKKTMCGEIENINGRDIFATRESGGTHGDSGGPAWIPGKGFVGVFTSIIGLVHNDYIEEISTGFTYPSDVV